MDWGLEVRAPLLNTQVALAGLTLRPKQQIKGNTMKYLLKALLCNKVGKLPHDKKLGFGAAIRPGSELETFLKNRIEYGLITMKERKNNELSSFMSIYCNETRLWSQNNLFATAIYLDWLNKMLDTFPHLS